ncbi:hypothetical protein [Massilia sp. DD77]|uniref:hypothetical protein n=1 Tax=Massilia sp. DD77 TaxID=3109349 RepID=UPI002FFEB410
MALHDPTDDLQYEAALDRKTRENAHLIVTALKAGSQLNTAAMIDELGEVLGDDQALGELIQRTARGENAFRDLINRLALEQGERQARAELAKAPALRRQQAAEDRFDMALLDRAA